MKILFLHQAFPAQFKWLAPALAARGDEVWALTTLSKLPGELRGLNIVHYQLARSTTPGVHAWLGNLENEIIRAESCFFAFQKLKENGFAPDVVIAHPGWGESLFVKDIWPAATLGLYCEHYHAKTGMEVGFDPEFPLLKDADGCLVRLSNQTMDMTLEFAEAGISPTHFQADNFPASFRPKIEVIHDGIETQRVMPNLGVQVRISDDLILTRADEVVTFVNRQFEPLRGCHIFMRALPELLARRPATRILLVGGENRYSYGLKPPDAQSWMARCIAEVKPRISDSDWARVHFIDHLPYEAYLSLLQLSSVHVYLTYPYVLSWSLIEAMSAGCAIVGSDTAPVREVIEHGKTGRLVNFFDVPGLASEVCDLLGDPDERARLGAAARSRAVDQYDLRRVCLPKQLAWVDRLAQL